MFSLQQNWSRWSIETAADTRALCPSDYWLSGDKADVNYVVMRRYRCSIKCAPDTHDRCPPTANTDNGHDGPHLICPHYQGLGPLAAYREEWRITNKVWILKHVLFTSSYAIASLVGVDKRSRWLTDCWAATQNLSHAWSVWPLHHNITIQPPTEGRVGYFALRTITSILSS